MIVPPSELRGSSPIDISAYPTPEHLPRCLESFSATRYSNKAMNRLASVESPTPMIRHDEMPSWADQDLDELTEKLDCVALDAEWTPSRK